MNSLHFKGQNCMNFPWVCVWVGGCCACTVHLSRKLIITSLKLKVWALYLEVMDSTRCNIWVCSAHLEAHKGKLILWTQNGKGLLGFKMIDSPLNHWLLPTGALCIPRLILYETVLVCFRHLLRCLALLYLLLLLWCATDCDLQSSPDNIKWITERWFLERCG